MVQSLARGRRFIALAAWMVGLTVQTGSLMSSDAFARYNVAHSLWTPAPAVEPSDDQMAVVGRDGVLQAPFGIGQSLLMLPGDIIASTVVRIVGLSETVQRRASIAVMCLLVFPLLTVAVTLAGLDLIRATGAFSDRTATAGALTLLLATTVLPYSQIHQENNLILLQTLVTFAGATRWALTGSRKALAIASAALGWMLLTRLPSAVATAPAVLLYGLMLVLRAGTAAGDRRWGDGLAAGPPSAGNIHGGVPGWFVRDIVRMALPILLVAVIAERAYHVVRFGGEHLLGTYWALKTEQVRALNPGLPVDWPFSGSFLTGFLGPLADPQRSIFITEPLLLLLVPALIVAARRLDPRVTALLTALVLSFVLYLVLHARLEFWSGTWAWGARYHTAPVAILAMLGACIALPQSNRAITVARRVLIPVAVAWQLCAVAIDYSAEEVQAACAGKSAFLVTARLSNLSRAMRGEELPQHLPCKFVLAPEWHLLTFLPFRNASHVPEGYRTLLSIGWGGLALTTGLLCLWLALGQRRLQHPYPTGPLDAPQR